MSAHNEGSETQPQQVSEERIRELIRKEAQCGSPEVMDALIDYLSLRSQVKQLTEEREWISVEQELPPLRIKVDVWVAPEGAEPWRCCEIERIHVNNEGWFWSDECGTLEDAYIDVPDHKTHCVTHWRRIPSAPQSAVKEGE